MNDTSDAKFNSMGDTSDAKFKSMDNTSDAKFNSMDDTSDAKFNSMDDTSDAKFNSMDDTSDAKKPINDEISSKQFLSRFNKTERQSNSSAGKRKWNEDGWGSGGYYKMKNAKLNDQNKAFECKSNIFDGVSIYVNGYTYPSSDILKQMICEHGGQFVHFFSKTHVSHVIATNLPDGKIKNLKWGDRVVHPNWITDSVNKGKLLPEDEYLIFSVAKRDGNVISFGQKEKQINELKSTEKTTLKGTINIDSDDESSSSPENNDTASYVDDLQVEPGVTPHLTTHTYSKQQASKPTLKAGDENYIEEYYAHSRLHHLSMWKAELKTFVASIQEKWKGREDKQNNFSTQKYIMHIDLDSFFASVALKVNPELRGKPIAVCHAKGSTSDGESWSEIASCNYEARKHGLRNGMFLKDAKKLCSQLVCVPYNFEEYRHVSQKFYEVMCKFTCQVQAVSCDEVILDITNLVVNDDNVLEFAETIRTEVFKETQCTASCGIGDSILIAKLATRHAKPDGKHYVPPSKNNEFMLQQLIKDLPGVGNSTRHKLNNLGIKSCAELQKLHLSFLQKEFGKKFGETLYNYARGIDNRKVKSDNEVKSVSAEINYGIRFTKNVDVEGFLLDLSGEVEKRLKENKKRGKVITLKLMIAKKEAGGPSKYMGHGKCDSLSKSCTLAYATMDAKIICEKCIKIIHDLSIPPEQYRGIGIQVTKLTDSGNDVSSSSNIFQFAKPVTQNKLIHDTAATNDLSLEISLQSTSTSKDKYNHPVSKLDSYNFHGWDPKVFEELPEDIRIELLNEKANSIGETSRNKNNRRKCKENKSKNSTKSELKIEQCLQFKSNSVPSSVLNELPEEIRNEILKSTDAKKQNDSLGCASNVNGTLEKLIYSVKEVTTTTVEKNSGEEQLTLDPVQQQIYHENMSLVNQKVIKKIKLKQKIPSFCGAENYDQVKKVLRNWIDTCKEPLEVDIDEVTQYFRKLLETYNMESLYTFILFFKRILASHSLWHNAFNEILKSVQEEVRILYHGTFPIPLFSNN